MTPTSAPPSDAPYKNGTASAPAPDSDAPASPAASNAATLPPVVAPPPESLSVDFMKMTKMQDVGRWYVSRFIQEVAKELKPGTRLLDAGAGECVYKRFFTHCKYESVDLAVGESHWNYSHLDYIASLDDLPMPDNTYDAVLSTQTLEHVEWPRECVAEMYRVLKPGGTLYLTAPMSHLEHQVPHDFWRYTSYGLRSVLTNAGFDNAQIEVRPFGGTFTRLAYQLPQTLSILPRGGTKGKLWNPVRLALKLYIRGWQALFLKLEDYDKQKTDPFGWAVIAKKSQNPGPVVSGRPAVKEPAAS